ncbi:MAG: DNA/RNA non-specific endonuclease [Tropicimonas sp.]|uniref:DNA/RNA non-specific endonuclease n=1 Tax=Tropicimonas sp. TaxID=2067044 RepID=UPI003A840EA9
MTRLSDREVRTERGQNIKTTTYDPETGRPISETGTIRQDFGSTPRGDNSAAIGRLGEAGDQGGHLGGHRFFGDTPDEGIAPQAGNLNMGAWRTMENEWADWTKLGYEVKYDIDVYPPGAARPDRFSSKYIVRDPKTGKVIYKNQERFRNKAGQSFQRITWREMKDGYGK